MKVGNSPWLVEAHRIGLFAKISTRILWPLMIGGQPVVAATR